MLRGIILLLISAFTFALSTAFAKLIINTSQVKSIEITFFRFFTGLLILLVYIFIKKKSLRPNRMGLITLRALFNTVAVIFFFLGVQYTTVTKTNMLNMTYPVFVFLLAPFLNSEKVSHVYYFYLLLTMAGLYFIIVPENSRSIFSGVNIGDIFALVSGLLAAFAISYLRETRKHDSSYIILFYLMLIGTVINSILLIPFFVIPGPTTAFYLLLCTLVSLTGQFTITIGYKYISAAGGSLVSSTRMLFAAILGISFFNEPLTLQIAVGGVLILISLAGISGIFSLGNLKKIG